MVAGPRHILEVAMVAISLVGRTECQLSEPKIGGRRTHNCCNNKKKVSYDSWCYRKDTCRLHKTSYIIRNLWYSKPIFCHCIKQNDQWDPERLDFLGTEASVPCFSIEVKRALGTFILREEQLMALLLSFWGGGCLYPRLSAFVSLKSCHCVSAARPIFCWGKARLGEKTKATQGPYYKNQLGIH